MNSAERFILKLTAATGAPVVAGNSILYSYSDPGAALTPRPTLSHVRYPGEGNRLARRTTAAHERRRM
jgi:hypothetical protein